MATATDYAHLMKGRDGKTFVKYEGDVAIICLDRGENRMNDLFIDGFNAALDEVESKENIKALITTGTGKFYCNGLDLEWMLALGANVPDHLEQFLLRWHELLARILTFPILTICAINGHCFAGGALLAFGHDYRIMSTDRGWFCLNEIFLNLRFAPWMIRLLNAKLTSPRATTDLIVLGKRCTAKDALEYGIIDASAPQNDLLKVAQSFASKVLPPNQSIERSSMLNMKSDVHKDVLDILHDAKSNMMALFKSRI